jgi:cobalamin biosynthesis Mg chelatase CobN
MTQAKKKTATKTAKKTQAKTKTGSKTNTRTAKKSQQQQKQGSNMFFVISMSVLAATLLFANLMMIAA